MNQNLFSMKNYLIPALILLAIGCNSRKNEKEFIVKNIPDAKITVDGILNEPAWQKANMTNHFVFPWEDSRPPKTEFRAFHDSENFYFSFVAKDDEIISTPEIDNEQDLIEQDRVEIYLTLDEDLKKYYCLELGANGYVLSYSASFPRQLDFSWDYPDIETGAVIHDDGYVVEARIPVKSLEKLGFPLQKPGSRIRAAIFRAQFNRLPDGTIEHHWLSWIDPEIDREDFHVPSSFGNFIFE